MSNSNHGLSKTILNLNFIGTLQFAVNTTNNNVFVWIIFAEDSNYPVSIHLLKVNNGNERTICEIWSELTIKTPEQQNNFMKRFSLKHLLICLLVVTNKVATVVTLVA